MNKSCIIYLGTNNDKAENITSFNIICLKMMIEPSKTLSDRMKANNGAIGGKNSIIGDSNTNMVD